VHIVGFIIRLNACEFGVLTVVPIKDTNFCKRKSVAWQEFTGISKQPSASIIRVAYNMLAGIS
jgi:hypothetical protein